MLADFLKNALRSHRERVLWRTPVALQGPQGDEIQIDGKAYLNFSSNDYLGLAADERLRAAYHAGLDRYGVGAGASHYVCGHFDIHEELCQALAAATGREGAVLFSSGYLANLGVIGAMLKKGGALYQDELNHVSLLDAGRLCRGESMRFPHRDCAALEKMLAACEADKRLIAVDGVFSMDGTIAPLPELAELARKFKAGLMVDDAHGFGVLGENGGGSVEHFGLDAQAVPLLMATLGKALGVFGAFVAGDGVWIEAVKQFSRTAIYTTAMPPAQAAAVLAALKLARQDGQRRARLRGLIKSFRAEAQAMGLRLLDSQTPIQPIIIGGEEQTLAISERLREQGIWLTAIRPPTVAEGTARLRVTLSAAHSEAQLARLLAALKASIPATAKA